MMYESGDKEVSHPSHYIAKGGMEVIDVIEAFTEGLNGIEATDTGNIIKYACRWKSKNGIQDLKKIMWYTQHLIDHLEEKKSTMNICYGEEVLKTVTKSEVTMGDLFGIIKNEKPINDLLTIDYDKAEGDMAVATIARHKGSKLEIIKTLTNSEATDLYNKLIK